MPSIERIEKNERLLDEAEAAVSALAEALAGYAEAREKIEALREYYNTDWTADVKDDENGLLPPDLKRGVLSEDAIFDLLTADAAVKETVAELFPQTK